MKVVVVGGGPAGMLAAISAAKYKDEVILLEKMNACGKKLLITGKGRCNITSSLKMADFIQNIPGNGKFLYSAFNNFTNEDIIDLLKKHGVEVKKERGNRIFPLSDNSKDVLEALIKELIFLKVKIILNSQVIEVCQKNNKITKVVYKDLITNKHEEIHTQKVILATGGMSYPTTGSTGEGYKIAQDLGHKIVKVEPSLVPLLIKEDNICKNLQGLSLRNIKIKVINIQNQKTIYEDFGEMLFTHFGVSGPVILSASAHIRREKNLDTLLKENKILLQIDLKPALTEEKLHNRIIKDFEKFKNKKFKNSLDELLPKKMIPVIIENSKIDEEKAVNEIKKVERIKLIDMLKKFTLTINGFRNIKEALITAGGISVSEIKPNTMESKIIKGLYFAGEIIDVDAYTGGFNLQIAYSTGYTAGKRQG